MLSLYTFGIVLPGVVTEIVTDEPLIASPVGSGEGAITIVCAPLGYSDTGSIINDEVLVGNDTL